MTENTVTTTDLARTVGRCCDRARAEPLPVTRRGNLLVVVVAPEVLRRRDRLVIALSRYLHQEGDTTQARKALADALSEIEGDVYPLHGPWWDGPDCWEAGEL